MKTLGLFLVFLSLLFLSACGTSNMTPKQTGPPIMSGDFSMTATSQTVSNTAFLGGSVQSDSSGHVTATLRIFDANFPCLQATSVSFSGTVDSQGMLSLTSSAVNGSTIKVSAIVSSDGKTISNGTYTITGSTCLAGDHGTFSGSVMPTTSGAYNGSFSMNGTTINVALTLKEGAVQPDGSFAITAGATFANSGPCGGFTSAGSEGGSQNGEFVSTLMVPNAAATVIAFSGQFTDGTAKTINGTFSIFGGPCDQMVGTSTLTTP